MMAVVADAVVAMMMMTTTITMDAAAVVAAVDVVATNGFNLNEKEPGLDFRLFFLCFVNSNDSLG